MKTIQFLFIFLLNFTFIFCQFPQGQFLIKNKDKYLTAGDDQLVKLSTSVNDYSVWYSNGEKIKNLRTGLVLEAEDPLNVNVNVSQVAESDSANQFWSWRSIGINKNIGIISPQNYELQLALAPRSDGSIYLAYIDIKILEQQWTIEVLGQI